MIACYSGEQLVGLTAMYCNNHESRTAYITFIAVLNNYRGNKIATKLLNLAALVSQEQGMHKIHIDTNNEIACKCYTRNGFEIISTQKLSEYNLTRYFLEKKL